jgi:hypothetical protein
VAAVEALLAKEDRRLGDADWQGADRVKHHVRGEGADSNAEEALAGFKRFVSCLDMALCGCAGLHRLAPRVQRFTRAEFKKNRILRS